jgi:hypothetical protein
MACLMGAADDEHFIIQYLPLYLTESGQHPKPTRTNESTPRIPTSTQRRLVTIINDATRRKRPCKGNRMQEIGSDTLANPLHESLTRPEARGLHLVGALVCTHVSLTEENPDRSHQPGYRIRQ